MVAIVELPGPLAAPVGVLILGLAYLNWRHIERVTAWTFGEDAAKRLATSPIGNKIGGTVLLVVFGLLAVAAGVVQTIIAIVDWLR